MRLRAPGAEIEVRAQPGSNPGHHDRVCAGIPRWPPARRTPDVPRQDLGSLIAELAQQPARPGRDPEGEVPAAVLTELQLGDPGQKLIEDSLTTRSYFWQAPRLPLPSPAPAVQLKPNRILKSRKAQPTATLERSAA